MLQLKKKQVRFSAESGRDREGLRGFAGFQKGFEGAVRYFKDILRNFRRVFEVFLGRFLGIFQAL